MLENTPKHYGVYVIDGSGRFRAGQSFFADGDLEAYEVAALAIDACSDVVCSFELWQETRLICDRKEARRLSIAEELIGRRRQLAADARR